MKSELVGLRTLNEPEKVFMNFRKIWLANREDSRETSKFSVKKFIKIFPSVKRSVSKTIGSLLKGETCLFWLF